MHNFKTVDIKGKQYVPVNERIKYFRTSPDYKGWSMRSEIIELTKDRATIIARIYDDKGVERASGLAYELSGSSYINKTSYVENCESSAWGRALGCLGIGIDTSIASADEVETAIEQQLPKKTSLGSVVNALLKTETTDKLDEFYKLSKTYDWDKSELEKIEIIYNNKKATFEGDK